MNAPAHVRHLRAANRRLRRDGDGEGAPGGFAEETGAERDEHVRAQTGAAHGLGGETRTGDDLAEDVAELALQADGGAEQRGNGLLEDETGAGLAEHLARKRGARQAERARGGRARSEEGTRTCVMSMSPHERPSYAPHESFLVGSAVEGARDGVGDAPAHAQSVSASHKSERGRQHHRACGREDGVREPRKDTVARLARKRFGSIERGEVGGRVSRLAHLRDTTRTTTSVDGPVSDRSRSRESHDAADESGKSIRPHTPVLVPCG